MINFRKIGIAVTMVLGVWGMTGVTAAHAAQDIATPATLVQKGVLTVCSDLSNPPAEGVADDGKTPKGAALDIVYAVAKKLRLKPEIDNYQFSGIFAALDTGKCDLIMASLGKTPERAQRYALVDYWSVASGLLVRQGNPYHMTHFEDLSGHRVSALLGSRNAKVVKQISDQLVSEGRAPIDIVLMNSYVAAFQELMLGRVDALVADTVVINYFNQQGHGRLEVGGVPVPPKTWSMAIMKNNVELKNAVAAAIDQLNADGTMQAISKKWGLETGVALCSSSHPCE
ncbi:ABC transporter substrate-binding protein [Paraburkholderia sp. J41]|uniref:ABC transporter substrate-binding protein n=1 Tax=Paraburkholderia sp. J41 TaxID=2805433 RepID=UPI002AC369FD|nr:ABC transporter substrate-binding protein [Paraburkholderia sp. J41]